MRERVLALGTISLTRREAGRRRSPLCGLRRLPLAALASCVLAGAQCAGARAASTDTQGMSVIPRPSTQLGLSYFKVQARPGTSVQAGALELQNPTPRRLAVELSPVDGETLDTLGSGYAPPGTPIHASTRWLELSASRMDLAPMSRTRVQVTLSVPQSARPGDYLSGISVEALHQQRQGLATSGVSIASVERYAIGVEVRVPGPRHPAIALTGASIEREPSGLSFAVRASNTGNVILQGVHGHVQIARDGHTIVSRPIAAGTFVAGTSIAYPVPASELGVPEGTRYRVIAELRYGARVARLDTLVTFGRREEMLQSHFEHTTTSPGSGAPWWEVAAFAVAVLYGMLTTILLVRRRLRTRPRQAA
jgi:hypothetical protein